MGDLASYDAYLLGGPFSGTLVACTRPMCPSTPAACARLPATCLSAPSSIPRPAHRPASLPLTLSPLPPPAVRGYNVGELAACRRYAEAAAELRVPVLGQQLFAFAEYGSDLGSSGAPLLACLPCAAWRAGLRCRPCLLLAVANPPIFSPSSFLPSNPPSLPPSLPLPLQARCAATRPSTTGAPAAAPATAAASRRDEAGGAAQPVPVPVPAQPVHNTLSPQLASASLDRTSPHTHLSTPLPPTLLQVGAIRAEVIRDNNSGKSHLVLAYGERF